MLYMALMDMSDADIAARLPMKIQTFRSKKKRPETFNLWELRIICDVLKIPPEERGMLI